MEAPYTPNVDHGAALRLASYHTQQQPNKRHSKGGERQSPCLRERRRDRHLDPVL